MLEEYKADKKEHVERVRVYSDFLAGIYAVLYGQCTERMKDRVKSHAKFRDAEEDTDGIKLLAIIKEISHTYEGRCKLVDQVVDIQAELFGRTQGARESLQKYYESMVTLADVAKAVGVTMHNEIVALNIAKDDNRNKANKEDIKAAEELELAMLFVRGATGEYAGYCKHLRNCYLDGHDNFPLTIHDAYNIMQRREHADGEATLPTNEGVAFHTTGTARDPPRCWTCQQVGHVQRDCPTRTESTESAPAAEASGAQHFTLGSEEDSDDDDEVGYMFAQPPKVNISKKAVLLDNQSTVDLFCNAKMLTNIRPVPTWMVIKCNAGTVRTNMMGDLEGYGPVWWYPQGLANILSLAQVRKKFTVEYLMHGVERPMFVVEKPDGKQREFVETDSGLYVCESFSKGKRGDVKDGVAMLTTVDDNRTNYTNDDYLRAVRARELQIKIGRPSLKDYLRIVTSNQLPNCPVTKADILAAEHIFGPDVGSLKGKTTRRASHLVKPAIVEQLPPAIMSRYRDVTLCADIMYINKVPMLVTFSRSIRFATVEVIQNRTLPVMLKAIESVLKIYARGGFRVVAALMDGEFAPMLGALADLGVALNATSEDEHVGEIERFIRVVKERVRATYNTLPFKHVPARLVIEMTKSAVFWLNAFPHERGISKDLSPRTIVTGQTVDFNRHCKYEFGQYVQTHESHSNDMQARTIGALALRPTGNVQGGFYFLSLSSGKILNRGHATPLPMPDDVIERVHRLARQQKANPGIVFMDRHRVAEAAEPVMWHDDDDEDDDDSDYDDDASRGDDDSAGGSEGVNATDDDDSDDDDGADGAIEGVPGDEAGDGEAIDGELDDAPAVDDGEIEGVPDEGEIEGVPAAADEEDFDARYGPRTGRYGLRARKPRSFAHLFTLDAAEEVSEPLVTAQMNMRQGLKAFGDAGVEAVRKEMQQLHDRHVMKAVPQCTLTPQQRKDALAYLMFLKRKRCGTVKGRGCADGRKQRAYTAKEDAASPTIATEAIFLTAIIDAMEGREVAVVDVPGAFMQAEMDELVHVRFTGKMVELLLEIDREMYEPCVTMENGEKVIYVELLMALYGTLRAARLFWEKLSAKLLEWGFEKNPYNPCVCNKIVNGKQITVGWHVDDLKISHVDVSVVDEFIAQMDEEFGKETPMNKSRGKVHDYLGMVLDYTKPGEVAINMVDYVKNILHHAPDDMDGTAATPAASHLFQISENPVMLSEAKKQIFVTIVMQCLYLSQRARPDIRTAISFLSTRLQQPDEDDYKKAARVIKYLRGSVDMVLTLKADQSGIVQWWVDASYAVHPDMKGHTGGTMTLGQGSVYSTSAKQKLVTRSSTESEVVGVHDVLPQLLWTGYFLKAQGFGVKDTKLYQDNMSSMLLEKNGRSSSTKRTRHMNVRYFFVKDRVAAGEVNIEHCPTGDMVADFFTKPLQGAQFGKLRNLVMNLASSSKYYSAQRSVLSMDENPNRSDSGDVTKTVTFK
ncbi:hypothetical protein MPSEU_000698200 [Mayamaea pseudoterrestris]|nr:hypothetical protein MPSEU_000698200 [Mayamaea pseudoterrestris]